MPQRAAVLLLVLLALLGPGSVWSEEDEEEVDYTRSRLSPGCPEDEVWTGWCAASGPWWVTASAWTFRHLGCFARGDDASHRVVARVAGLRVAGVTAPLQCLRACVGSDDHARTPPEMGRATFFAVGDRDRSCYCVRGVPSAEAAGLSPAPAAECKPPDCRTSAVGMDVLAGCTTLLGGGLSCGEDFCDDASRCEMAGMCTRSCGMPSRDSTATCNDAHSHDRLQLYAIVPSAVPEAALPRTPGANPCSTTNNVTTCPVTMQRKSGNALTACCACGGGNVNDFGGCSDHKRFLDSRGRTCADYAALDLCSDDGFGAVGPGWRAEWGSFRPDAKGRVSHSYVEASIEAVISTGTRPEAAILAITEDAKPLSILAGQVSDVQRGLTTWKGESAQELEFPHRDDPGRLGITLAPLGGTHVEIQGRSVMAPCGFHSVRALTATKACRSCDAWWDVRDEWTGAGLAQAGRGAKWYYEIVVGSDGIAQVGFATHGFVPSDGQGVGDDPYGWAFDGNRVEKWHDPTPDVDDGSLEEWQVVDDEDGAVDFGEQWYEGDVVGCLLDLTQPNAGIISFTLTTPGEETRDLGPAFILDEHDRQHGEFYPAGTFVDGIWTFRFAAEELQYAPSGVEHFTPPTRPAKLTHASGSLGALMATVSTDGCLDMLVQAIDPAANLFYSFVLARPPLAPEVEGMESSQQICSVPLEPECDSPALTADTMVMWVILGSAATIGVLTMFTMVQGERLRRRRQFQLISGAALQLDNESVQRVLIDDAARTHFRQKYERLQRMLFGFGRNGLIDITVSRDTLLRDVIELFDTRPDLLDARTLRSQGLRIRFVDELGIDEGGLRREFYQVLFGALVNPHAVVLALPKPDGAAGAGAASHEGPAAMSDDATADAAGSGEQVLALFEATPGYSFGVNRVAASAVHQLGSAAVTEIIERIAAARDSTTGGWVDGSTSPRMAAGFAPDPVGGRGDGSMNAVMGPDGIELEMTAIGASAVTSRVGEGSPEAYLLRGDGAVELTARPQGGSSRGRRGSTSSFEPEPEPEPEPELQFMDRAPPTPRRRTAAAAATLRRPRMARLRTLTSLPAVREALRRQPSGAPGSGSRSDQFVQDLIKADPLALYRLCGIFLAKAIIDDVRLNVIFTRSLYSQLLSHPVGLEELKEVDEELYNSLTWLLETDLNDEDQLEGGAEALGLYFDAMLPPVVSAAAVVAAATASNTPAGAVGGGLAAEGGGGMLEAEAPVPAQAIELKPGGAEIPVTEENKEEFVALRTAFAHTGLVERQMQSMREGFFQLLPDFARLDFDGAELELLLHGVPDINLVDWQHHTVYRGGFDEEHPTIVAFWELVEEMDQEMRGKLLHFTTGCSRVPLEGFSSLRGDGRICRFTIACTDQAVDALPRAHCCFNRCAPLRHLSVLHQRPPLPRFVPQPGGG